ncbi:ribosome maturation factor RimM [Haloechinothrix salitolerans]|uniref:Ribosome maturation factor RimM n=1 Tax=Haloechinothrix salitolerans TaxID=926830 RepID=A0ABW2C3D6_9PSEU
MDVTVGRVAKAHGIGGELAVDVRTDSPELRFAVGAVLTAKKRGQPARSLTVASARSHGNRLLLRCEEVAGRDDAETLRGALLLADTDDLPPTEDPDEFYDHELAGLAAEFVDGTPAGTVREVVHVPSGELLAVDVDGSDVLVPFVKAIVPTVDVAAGKVVIDPPDGLFE